MSKTKKKFYKKYVSPAGVAVYPKLHVKDVYNGTETCYKVELRMDTDEAKEVFGEIQERLDNFVEQLKDTMEPSKAKRLVINDVLVEHDDGTSSVKFSSSYKPVQHDAEGNILSKDVDIWGGSIIKIAFNIGDPYNTGGKVGYKLYMDAVQIIELKTSSQEEVGGSPFTPVKGGFVAKDTSDEDEDIGDDIEEEESPFSGKAVKSKGKPSKPATKTKSDDFEY